MKIYNLISGTIFVALLASCSAVYKTDQTPDDVYYSPGKPVGEATTKNNTSDDYSYNKEEDNYLRMKVQNPSRWNSIDDYAYWNSYNTSYYSYNTVGYSNFYGNYWNNYYSYNLNPYLSLNYGYSSYPYLGYGYNSYYPAYGYNYGAYSYYNPGVYYKTVRSNTGPRANMGAYSNHTFSNQNTNYNAGHSNYVNGNTQPQTGVGRLLRTIVTGGNQTQTNTPAYNPARTFNSSPSTYSPSSSSSAPAAASSRTSGSGGGGRRN